MNRKTLIIIIVLVIAIAITGILLWSNRSKNMEENVIQPQEEITDEQMRTALVTLYYMNKETKELTPEGKMIDVKKLLADPYETLINLLIEQPKNEKLQSAIPNGTKVLGAELKGDVVYLDLSNEFIENHEDGEKAEQATIKAIVNTLTELNEVSGVKILINGQENKEFKDGKINFKETFFRVK
ncbi:MAG: GerMN domain-containing protein [Clostridiales bacterium]